MTRNPVSKAFKVLDILAQDGAAELGVRDIAAMLDISPSNAHGLLTTLVEEGMVRQNEATSRYALGGEMLRMAHVILARFPLRQAALGPMRALVQTCKETALLGLYNSERQQMMFSAIIDSTHSLRYAIELNVWRPLHAGASGLAIMAFLPDADIDAIIGGGNLPALTAGTITDPGRLRSEIEAIRTQGYALTHGQRITGAVGIAAPAFGAGGDVVGDICLTIPEQRFDTANQAQLVDLLKNCADSVTRGLGGSGWNGRT